MMTEKLEFEQNFKMWKLPEKFQFCNPLDENK